jgi:hypothetical protein
MEEEEDFLYMKLAALGLGFTKSPIQQVRGTLSLE